MLLDTAHVPAPPGSRRIPAQLWDAGLEARRLLEAASADASSMIARAKGESESIRTRAAADGREEGLASATEMVARAALARDRLLADAEPQLVELSFEIARRVLERVVERDRDAVAAVAARALEAVRHRQRVTLRTHPHDAATLREAEPRLCEMLAGARCIAVVDDPSIGRGGVVVETEAGSVDARLASQLEALRRALELASGSAREATEAPAPRAPRDGSGLGPPCAP